MTAPTCSKCHDTGSLSRDVYDGTLDCTHCEAATELMALLDWFHQHFAYVTQAEVWRIYQHGKAAVTQPEAKAAPVVAALSKELVDIATAVMDQHGLLNGLSERATEKLCVDMADAFNRAAAGNSQGQAAQPEHQPVACRMQGGICACRSGGSYGGCAIERGITHQSIGAAPVPAAAPELATALRGLHGWAIEMLDMAEFKAWPDADRADFMLKMRAAEDLLKNYPRKP